MHQISILTASGDYNVGDELICFKECEYLHTLFPEAKIHIFTYDQKSFYEVEKNLSKNTHDFVNYFPNNIKKHPLKNFGYLIKNIFTLYKSDLIIIGGGGILYDNETQKNSFPLNQWKFRTWIAKLFRKKILFWSISLNLKNTPPKKLLPLFTGENTFVSVRDLQSQNFLHAMGIEAKIIFDPVFLPDANQITKKSNYDTASLQNENTNHHSIDNALQNTLDHNRGEGQNNNSLPKKKIIGIAFRKAFLKNEQENIEKIIEFCQKKGYEIVLLSHSFHPHQSDANDFTFLEPFAKKYTLSITRTQHETLETYKNIDVIFGMRFHSYILATIYDLAFFAFDYAPKTQELLKILDYPYSISAKEFDFEKWKTLFEIFETQQEKIKFDLQKKLDTIQTQLQKDLRNIFEKIGRK